MARPNTQEQRRSELVEAALKEASTQGLRSLSLTDVAKRAGLTRGALLYYFDDLDALLVEAHRAGTERFCDHRDAVVAQLSSPAEKLRAAISAGLPSGPDDALMRLLYEFDFMAGQSELHDTLVQQMYLRQTATYRAIFEEGNASGAFSISTDLDQATMNMVALEDAYSLHIVAGNRLVTVDMACDAMLAFAEQIGCRPLP
ncbi:TetR family transcriptional regulator [Paenarthrobacter sp. CCNWLY172]|uniref:TetR/AcrR family transcriptional regulator n=1 Tax=Paenarthrobacter sp. AMU7 TaxID=3162492 RepID=A0AB39YT21_9MICC|nr:MULTISPECIES: TetR family transcriptional regulator [Micrococcaceae]QSZ47555.1 TetR family transcriptional regulator [Arthrobacter sp. D5-1]WGM21207.1 TetR family transcriptional regulator [Paenarthrobacter sp. OM7]